jgi:hypothetical protein
MLGFILSKMQMLLFAVGIAVVALMFYDFVARIGLSESANTLLITNAKLVSDQTNNDLLCSDKFTTLPSALSFGFNSDQFFYDLEFSKQNQGSGSTEPGSYYNLLIMRIVEHNRNAATSTTPVKKNIIASQSIISDAEFVLVDPGFLLETTGLEASYNSGNNQSISLYPRASSRTAVLASSPDSYAIVKEVIRGKKIVYIIPCSTEKEAGNCIANILRVGCYKLKLTNPNNSDPVPSCFNKSSQVNAGAVNTSVNYKWSDCKLLFPEIAN